MKNYKYVGLFLLSLGFIACDVDNELEDIQAPEVINVPVNGNGVDFSNYVAIGASFSAGYTDGALFKIAQENSFPNILATKFAAVGGGDFKQPLMADNTGGLLYGGNTIQAPRLFFNGAGPARLGATPTTETTTVLTGGFNNYGIPGAKSFHIIAPGYGNVAGVPAGLANPYYARMASSSTSTVLTDALTQSPTFFTLSEMGGNDVLGFATSGGFNAPTAANPMGTNAIYQADATVSPAAYGGNDITNVNVFAAVFSGMVDALAAGGRKGVIANLPYITDLPYFTTVPYNPVPLDEATAAQLNAAFAAYNGGLQQILDLKNANLLPAQVLPLLVNYNQAEVDRRKVTFVAGRNAVLILDENLSNLTPINAALTNMRQATPNDLLVLPSSSFIGTTVGGNAQLINGVSVPLADQWVLTPEEKALIINATNSYNTTIENVANSKGLAFVDFKGILGDASTTGIQFGEFNLRTNLVTGGLVSLDGIHLTARGYALMANRMLEAIDLTYGSNFGSATNGLANASNYPAVYSPALR